MRRPRLTAAITAIPTAKPLSPSTMSSGIATATKLSMHRKLHTAIGRVSALAR